ncbi:MAG: hypothetical protein R3F61_16160 [Myxococcota bacterium]
MYDHSPFAPTRRYASAIVLLAGLAGCTRPSGIPDLGPCAEPSKGDTYGEVGIGTCISGPVDLRFVEREGRTFLAVSNADPFRNFDGGSVLLLDWDDTVGRFDSERVLTADLASTVIPTEHFIGGLGWLQDARKNLLFVTRRLSEDARTRTSEDSAFVFDLETAAPWIGGGTIELKDDPGSVAVASDGTVYVLNYSDHSVSVFDATGDLIVPIDLAPAAAVVPFPLDDADGSGSVAELDRLSLTDETRAVDDAWTLTWIPGQWRAWASYGNGFQRWSSGGAAPVPTGIDGTFEPVGFTSTADGMVVPVQLDDISSSAPFALSAEDGFDLTMLFAQDGAIFYASTVVVQDTDGLSTVWGTANAPLLGRGPSGAFDELRAGASMAIANGDIALYYDAASSADPGSASISMATSQDGLNYTSMSAPLLAPSGGFTSFEQPYVQLDGRMNVSRMWLSMFDGTRYSVGYSESDDGLSWSVPLVVAGSSSTELAAPVVRFHDGRYLMWATSRASTASEQWYHVLLESPDGLAWSDPVYLFDSEAPFDARNPPRLAVGADSASSWRVTGVDSGTISVPAVAGLIYRDVTHGFELTVPSGHELSNDLFPDGRAELGIEPGSHYDLGGIDQLYVTNTGSDERRRISVLRGLNDDWSILSRNLIPAGSGGNVSGVYSPVVHQFDGTFVMFYAALDGNGISSMHAATSPDGITFTPTGRMFPEVTDLGDWAGAAQEPHSVEVDEDGTVRVWLAGSNGSRYRIGAVVAEAFDPSNPHAGFVLDRPEFTDYQLGTGVPGSIDDSGAKDPMVVKRADGKAVMYYSGFDGAAWHLAFAERADDGTWVRRVDPTTDETLPAMSAIARTFSAGGVEGPVARLRGDGTFEIWYAGSDFASGGTKRLGRAIGRGRNAFAVQRRPTYGDTLALETQRGDDVVSVIELAQNVEAFLTTGVGTTDLILDEERGFLYVPSKLSNLLYVVDIRDDSRIDAVDFNAMDLEGLIRLPTISANNGFRGGALSASSDRLYLTTRNPESVLVIDLESLIDNGVKEVSEIGTVGSLPVQDTFSDAGVPSVASIGGGHPALATVANGAGTDELLLMPHFRDNSVSVFDLGIGAYGTEIAYLPYLGENPHVVRVSPDGRWAVVANYLGDVDDDEQSSSTLAVIDLDPASPTWLQATNWIVNR